MPSDKTDALTRWLLSCGAIGGFGFIAVFLIAGAIRPHYDMLYQPVSALSLSAGGWVQIANFIVTGLLMLACALGLRRALTPGRGATSGPILIGIYGLCLVGAGVFVTDPGFGYPPGAPSGVPTTGSLHGTLHTLISLVVFVSVSIACFVFASRFSAQPHSRAWAVYSFLTGLAVPAFIVAASAAWFSGGPGGLFQRLSISAGWVWVGLLAIRTILGLRSQAEPRRWPIDSTSSDRTP